jgi:hypothetical protein
MAHQAEALEQKEDTKKASWFAVIAKTNLLTNAPLEGHPVQAMAGDP